jgi:hypothetical protein
MTIITFAKARSANAVVGHELIHRRELKHKIMEPLDYSKRLNLHFFIMHIKGHHKLAGTYKVPRKNTFWIGIIPACYKIGWD